MERKKLSTTVYITHDQNSMLKMLNQKTKVPIAEYIREGIDMVLERHKNLLPGQMLLIQDDPGPNGKGSVRVSPPLENSILASESQPQ